ncbi:hypothetical protein AB0F71_18660 [Kitasatospora sp. NPDC028055]|uniref:hypothetical protein n=1 Tax=Kitasatospora sp. NPDC028055 TaxID=3155653 RepID=UPI0033C15BE5
MHDEKSQTEARNGQGNSSVLDNSQLRRIAAEHRRFVAITCSGCGSASTSKVGWSVAVKSSLRHTAAPGLQTTDRIQLT